MFFESIIEICFMLEQTDTGAKKLRNMVFTQTNDQSKITKKKKLFVAQFKLCCYQGYIFVSQIQTYE
jgi:hypothetical protein